VIRSWGWVELLIFLGIIIYLSNWSWIEVPPVENPQCVDDESLYVLEPQTNDLMRKKTALWVPWHPNDLFHIHTVLTWGLQFSNCPCGVFDNFGLQRVCRYLPPISMEQPTESWISTMCFNN
jgi:hypothetical protein